MRGAAEGGRVVAAPRGRLTMGGYQVCIGETRYIFAKALWITSLSAITPQDLPRMGDGYKLLGSAVYSLRSLDATHREVWI